MRNNSVWNNKPIKLRLHIYSALYWRCRRGSSYEPVAVELARGVVALTAILPNLRSLSLHILRTSSSGEYRPLGCGCRQAA
jgi:hypothetical protein